MKKQDFVTLLLGVVGGLLFALGMCVCLLPEWNVPFNTGVVVAAIGAVVLLVLALVRWKMAGKHAKPNWKLIGKATFGTLSALTLGAGMCLIMVYHMIIQGIIVGVIGIVLLLCLIPMCMGLK